MRGIILGVFVWLSFISLLVAQAVPEAKVTVEEIQQLQEQITALQKKLDSVLNRTVDSHPGELAEMQTSGSRVEGVSSRQEVQQVPSQGLTEKGLYQNLTAASAPEQTYGSGILDQAVKIGGYGSFRFESNNIDLGPRIADLPPVRRGFDAFDFRRFVFTLDAAPAERLRFYAEIEFERLNEIEIERTAIPENRGVRNRAGIRFIQEVEGQSGGEIAMEQAWVQYDFAQSMGLRMGVVLPPVGRFNILHDDDYWDLPRRTLVDRGGPVLPVKSAWRELGAGLVGNLPVGQGDLDYQFYVLGGARLDFTLEEVVSLREGRNLVELEPEIVFASGPFDGTDPADAISWRVAYSPALGSEFAFSGYHGQYTPDYLNADSSIHSLGFDGKLTLGRFEVEGEFVYTDFGRMEAVLGEIAAQAVDSVAKTSSAETAELETEVETEFAGPLTNQRYGYWVDFKYRFWPGFLDRTFLGRGFENPQLIPIIRLERIWFNDFVREFTFLQGAPTSLETEDMVQQRTTVGLTYRPATSVAFTAAFEHNQRIQGSTLIFPNVLGLGRVPDKSYDSLLMGVTLGF